MADIITKCQFEVGTQLNPLYKHTNDTESGILECKTNKGWSFEYTSSKLNFSKKYNIKSKKKAYQQFLDDVAIIAKIG